MATNSEKLVRMMGPSGWFDIAQESFVAGFQVGALLAESRFTGHGGPSKDEGNSAFARWLKHDNDEVKNDEST